jgi:hypothetical protein
MWIDRLTQTQLKTLPAIIDAGRYQFSHSDSTERFNQHSDINAGDLLLSDGSERFQLLNDSGSYNKPVVDNPERINLFQNAILTLGETLIKQENSINPNADLKLLSPLLPAAVINAELDLLPVEKTLQTVLEKGHLHEIAHHPRLDVRYVEEITDVARAKRLAKGALVHLASHSECWQRQTLSGVVPKKVKARFSEDDYQIYENRVFARLIDKLHHHICSRIRTVEQLQQTLNDALGFEDNPDTIDYRISQKICTLWGQTFDAESTLEALEQLDSTLSALSEMLKGITSLRQAGLYLMIPRHVQVGAALHRTNILNHDAHYRHLAILWEQLNRLQQTSQLTPAQRFAQQQLLASHYSRYAGLVLQHALVGNAQIKLKLSQPTVKKSDTTKTVIVYEWAGQMLRLQQNGFDWTLHLIPQDHQQTYRTSERTILEFTPWFGFSELPELSTPLASNRIILWPSIDNISNEKADDQQLGWCALSPLDLYCVERIGWLIDKTLNQHLTRNYASPIEKIPTQAENVIRTIQTGSTSSTTVELTGAPPQLRLFEALNQQDADNLRKALNDDNAVQQAHQLQQQMLAITALTHCPVCAKNAQLTHQPPSGFRIECQECGTGRYLKQAKEELEIKFREKDPNNLAGAGFAARGRWAMPDR